MSIGLAADIFPSSIEGVLVLSVEVASLEENRP
jgi:hypothetical protein